MSADIVRIGTRYRDVLGHSVALGNIPADEVDALYAARIALIAAGKPFRTRQTLASGLVITLELKPLPGGGWMTICDDVSRLARLETELQLQTERSQHALAQHVARPHHVRRRQPRRRLQRAVPAISTTSTPTS